MLANCPKLISLFVFQGDRLLVVAFQSETRTVKTAIGAGLIIAGTLILILK